MSKVTVKNAVTRLKVTPAIARELVDIVNGPKGIENSDYLKMERLNKELRGYGVEAIRIGDDLLSYVNLGDTYTPTICLFQGKFEVVDWGTIVEEAQARGITVH